MSAKQKTRSIETPPPASSASSELGPSRTGLLSESAGLKLLVFVSGAVLMGLEIVGSRILAPYFGNSVFVWGSLISLFLIALSLGYYFGGRWADQRPSRSLLGAIVITVAVMMFAVAAVSRPVCDAVLAQGFGEQSGPFLAATILFLLPSIGMGMVSPFAIRLGAHAVHSVGRTAGTLYALSTVGSIAGTMLTTFVLIPSFGAGTILKGLAAALLATGVLTFPFGSLAGAAQGTVAAIAAIAAGVFGVDDSRAALPPGSKLVAEYNTPYHNIAIVDDEAAGSRDMRFDRFRESVVEIAQPHRSLSEYTYYFHLAFLTKPEIKRTLFIGAGGGVGPRSFHMHDAVMAIDVVDIDQQVLDAARDHFYMDDKAATRTFAADGRSFVRDADEGSFDCIVLDAFTIGGRIPFHLVSREFFELVKSRLSDGGVLLMNINSAPEGPKSQIYRSMYRTIDAAFDGGAQAFVLHRGQAPPRETTNIILLATKGQPPLSRDEWAERAADYASESYIGRDMIERMVDDLAPRLDDDAAPLFTDDYAPIETMPF